ncbi:MAG: DUF1232 domain-containing protein [Thermoflexales bacterium]|nr:DUF1232 domain-containing protein [Thermoflexales bacterium]
MEKFDSLLQQEIARYEGRHDDLIYQAPALYRLMVQLLDDKRLPGRLRPLIACTVAYFILPADVIPEDIHGPYGYADDIWLCAWAAGVVRREVGDDVLTENWDGEAPLIELLQDILAREADLIGDQRDKILWYTGCDRLIDLEL